VHFLREGRYIIGVWCDSLGEIDHLEDKGIAGKIILTWIIENTLYGVK